MIKTITNQAGEGKYQISLITTFTSDGLVCQLFGGERPHVGAVVLSIPRPSLRNESLVSCNSSVLPLLGHKEDEIAKPLGEKLAKHFNQPVVLIAGIHIDNADGSQIKKLMDSCWQAIQKLLDQN